MRRPMPWLLGVAFALLLVGGAAITLTVPSFTRVVASRTSLATQAGLPLPRMLDIAEQVRLFVVDTDAGPLPATVDGRSGFDAAAVAHLADVR